MKKIMFVLCTATLMSVAGCSKDDEKSSPSSGDDTATFEELDIEGMYGPGKRILSVTENGTPVESWVWQDGRLAAVNNSSTGEPQSSFTYGSDNRVQSVTLAGNSNIALVGNMLNGTFTVDYTGERVNRLTLTRNAVQLAEAQLSRNATGKVSRLDLTFNDAVILPVVNTLIAQVAGNSANMPAITLSGATGKVDFSWVGDNVIQACLNVGINANTTKGAIMNSALANYLGSLSTYLAYVPDDTPIVFNITLSDTADYDYDSYHNPFRHYLGQIDISTLSTNNVTSENHRAGATIKAGLSSALMLPLFNYPIRQGATTYTYTYGNGYPTTVTASNGTVKGYTYINREKQ